MNKGLQITIAAMVCGTMAGVAAFVVLHKGRQSQIAALEVSEAHVKHELQARVEELALCEKDRVFGRAYVVRSQSNLATVRGEYQEVLSRIAELEKEVTSAKSPSKPVSVASASLATAAGPPQVATAWSGEIIDLNGSAVVFQTRVQIKNNDSFDWVDVTILLHVGSSATYDCKRSRIRAGASIAIELGEFATHNTGERFNPVKYAVNKISVVAQTSTDEVGVAEWVK